MTAPVRVPAGTESSPPSGPVAVPARPEPSAPRAGRGRARFVALGLVTAIAVAGGTYWALTVGHESTNDAQVEGHVEPVSVRIPGIVTAVKVRDNEVVEAGAILVELDRADQEARLAVARADYSAATAAREAAEAQAALTEKSASANLQQAKGGIAQAASTVTVSRASVDQARADVAAAESRVGLARTEYQRTEQLFASGSVSPAARDAQKAALDQAEAAASLAEARLASAEAAIRANLGGVQLAEGRVAAAETISEQVAAARAAVALARAREEQARASVRIAELNLSYTTVRAPGRGVVSRRNVEVGQTVSPERPLLALVPLDDVWVVANMKETQVADLRPGQHATIWVDAFPGRPLQGHVDSLAAGTGSRFALLPADNASGNFVKVVQRVPVLLRFDAPPADMPVRPGMSAYVTVDTH
jgi:membrane fusion protein (multidrug efflux system)